MSAVDTATDELNALLERASALFDRDFHGVYAAVPLPGSGTLGFGCIDDKWGLIFYRGINHQAIKLTSASREERVACAGYLGALRGNLLQERDDLYERIKEAQVQVLNFLEAHT